MDRLQQREADRKILGYSNLTDWFIHEARNSFAIVTVIPGHHWTKEYYEHGRENS